MSVTEEAVRLAKLIKDQGDVRATADVRGDLRPPCVLVEPVPRRTYDATLCGDTGFQVTWQVVALVASPADLRAARDLERLTDAAVAVLAGSADLVPVSSEKAVYVLGTGNDAVGYPAQITTLEGSQTWQS